MNPTIDRALEFAGVHLDPDGVARLTELAGWLGSEALAAGAVGPSEWARIEGRHVADSIMYASAWDNPPSACWDLGAGAGLPGLVLATIWPHCLMTLIDRSVRRIELVRRGARVLGLTIETRIARIEALQGPVEAIVSRAAMPAPKLWGHISRLLMAGGVAVVSGTGAPVPGYEVMEIPDGILDHSPRLLMMRAT